MIKLDTIQTIYFIGIGGIGMSALARYFLFHGKQVGGYDKTPSVLTRQLEQEGIPVNYTDDPDLVSKNADLVVYTPAVPANNAQLRFYQENGFTLAKRSEVLGAISEGNFNICVGGTHGKTTISTMVAHILRHTGFGCNAFLGGIAVNYNTNFWHSENNTCVIEADEYDRSFLRLNPDLAVISAMDADHLDIYGTEDAMNEAFIDFSRKIKPGGTLFTKLELARRNVFGTQDVRSYSASDTAAWAHASDVRIVNGSYQFDMVCGEHLVQDISLNMGGLHNVENAIVAIAIAIQLGISEQKIRSAVQDFRGVKRRFEYVIRKEELVYIDDYAHHPEELSALISSTKALFKDTPCTIIFQPHLFSRTRDFADAFAKSLDMADEVILLPIYPARELPIAGVSSEMISSRMNKNAVILEKNELIEYIEKRFSSRPHKKLLITAGAGDIDQLVDPINKICRRSNS